MTSNEPNRQRDVDEPANEAGAMYPHEHPNHTSVPDHLRETTTCAGAADFVTDSEDDTALTEPTTAVENIASEENR
ncbi:MAG: hypothetical protein WKH64_14540 [Chloroflexia bacterium]